MLKSLMLAILFSNLTLGAHDAPLPCCQNKVTITSKESSVQFPPEETDYEDKVLYLLDQQSNIFLFRGNLPEQHGKFCYDSLVTDMKACLLPLGKQLSPNFKLLTLSFLNHFTENKEIEIEQNWFLANPEKGCFWLDSLYGALLNPVHLSHLVRDLILKHHDMDGLKYLMKELGHLVNSTCPTDFVIYIHCAAGKDRTGEASACYLMQYKGYSYHDAIALDQKIAKRDLRDVSMNAIRWYAFYLRDILGFSTIGKIDGE